MSKDGAVVIRVRPSYVLLSGYAWLSAEPDVCRLRSCTMLSVGTMSEKMTALLAHAEL